MVDPETFERRLAKLEELLRRLRDLANEPRDQFLADPGLQAQAERWLQLAAECSLDLAHHLIADRGWETPASYREAFATLGREGVLAPELAEHMEGWAGLRNLLVHLYTRVDYEEIYSILTSELDQLEAYAQAVTAAG